MSITTRFMITLLERVATDLPDSSALPSELDKIEHWLTIIGSLVALKRLYRGQTAIVLDEVTSFGEKEYAELLSRMLHTYLGDESPFDETR